MTRLAVRAAAAIVGVLAARVVARAAVRHLLTRCADGCDWDEVDHG